MQKQCFPFEICDVKVSLFMGKVDFFLSTKHFISMRNTFPKAEASLCRTNAIFLVESLLFNDYITIFNLKE